MLKLRVCLTVLQLADLERGHAAFMAKLEMVSGHGDIDHENTTDSELLDESTTLNKTAASSCSRTDAERSTLGSIVNTSFDQL